MPSRACGRAWVPLRRHDATGRWCVFLDLERQRRVAEEREAEERARREAEAARREAEARQREEARQRAAAARDKVSVVNLRRGETTLRETGVFGEVVNGSAETLRTVRIAFEFLDAAGNVVEERTWTPILAGALIASSGQTLPPGHRRRFGMRADDVTAAWAGRVRARVVEVEIAIPAAATPP
jgi:hypothetical protein